MIFHSKKKKIQSSTPKFNNDTIEIVAPFNFLELAFNEHLTWKCHIN